MYTWDCLSLCVSFFLEGGEGGMMDVYKPRWVYP